MTRRSSIYIIVALLFAWAAASCNDDSGIADTSTSYSNCEVSSFQLQANNDILTRLDSVYFAIDLVKAEIYNADSLPVGTNTSRLQVKVGTESASACNITYHIPGTDRDTTVNIIDSPNDSINFSDGPVKLEIVSYSGQARRTYNVRVNVHQVAPDTLWWDQKAIRPLPTTLSSVKAQKSVMFKDEIYCFTTDGSSYSLSKISDPFTLEGNSMSVALPAGVEIGSIASTTEALYCLDGAGRLYASSDGQTWTDTETVMSHIYGGYGERLLGAIEETDGWKQVTYPATTTALLPQGCPVKGNSGTVEFTSKWNINPSAVIFGGVDASGEYSAYSWIYDGDAWSRLSNTAAPVAVTGAIIFPYNTPKVNTNTWRVSEQSALIAMGGMIGNGAPNDSVYVSIDFGISWKKGEETLQLPGYFPRVSGADVFVVDHLIHAQSSSRVIAPVEEWECPYIYVFGGVDKDGTLVPTVRRGVINRFTFKPIY